jgi:superfamily I DNA/RNA helicase
VTALDPAGLDRWQQEIVTRGGSMLVVAGPGAGKTRVLTHAIGHRVGGGLPPERCLAVTFTRRARDELAERLAALIPGAAGEVTVATFHGLGLLILREQCKRLGLDAGLKVADEPTRLAVLRQLAAGGRPAGLASRISASKRAVAAAAATPSATASDDDAAALTSRYDAALRERGLVDTDDLLALPVALLGGDPALAQAYRSRWTDVFVDEYQDIDEAQYRLLRLLTGEDSRVCAIGDPDQAIYGFRGGDVGYFLRFREDFPAAADLRLSRSYRSAPTIVRAAMQLIRPGTLVPGRELVPARADIPDGPVTVHAAAGERDEADAVAAEIEKLLGGASFHALDSRAVDARDRAEHQLSFADFAVLYRTSWQAAAVADALAKRGFPVQRRSHARLADMAGVPEILASLSAPVLDSGPVPVARRLAAAVTAALASVPERSPAAGAAGPGAERGRAETLAAIGFAAEVLTPLAARCGTDLDRFLDELALGAEVDTWDPRADRISLLTLHAAKGLEFPVVFIVGCDDGLLPLRPWSGAVADYAEERRLLFVGMTRATTRLVLMTAAERSIHGTLTGCSPSPFLASVEPGLLDRRGGDQDGPAARRDKAQQARLF